MFKDLRVVFMSTPSFGVPALKYLIENTNVCLVVTQPDKLVGRKKVLTAPIIKKIAIDNNIPVFQPINIKKEYDEIKKVRPDLIVTAAYGQIVPIEVLNIPLLGCVNLHGSILPKYRGAAPIQWSIINGDDVTGVSLMYMDEKMDTGDIIDIQKININKFDNYETLYNKLSIVGKEVLEKNLESIINKTNKREKQNDSFASYARMLKREDELIDFNQKAIDVVNKINGVYPNGYIKLMEENLTILEADYILKGVTESSIVCEVTKKELLISALDGLVNIKKVKPSGKNVMDIKAYLNGVDKAKLKNLKINID